MKKLVMCLVMALVMAGSASAAVVSITNHSFEFDGINTSTITGWTNISTLPAGAGADDSVTYTAGRDGAYHAWVYGAGGLTQTTSATYAAGDVLELTVAVGNRSDETALSGWDFGLYYDNGGTLTEVAKTQGNVTWADGTMEDVTLQYTVGVADACIGSNIVVVFGEMYGGVSNHQDNVRLDVKGTEIAHNPVPAEGAEDIDVTSGLTLYWDTGLNQAGTGPNPDITKHYLYVSSPYDPELSNVMPIEVAADVDPVSYFTMLSAIHDVIYYWRVDESINDSGPNDPETVVGALWSFQTTSDGIPGWTSQWEFEGNLFDSVGQSPEGNFPGSASSPGYQAGISGLGLEVNGTEDVVTIQNSGTFFNFWTSGLTVNCWLKTSVTDGWMDAVSKQIPFVSGWTLAVNDGIPVMSLQGYGNIYGRINIADDRWHMVTALYDPDIQKARMFVDGVLQTEGDGITESQLTNDLQEVVIGAADSAGTDLWNGMIDDVHTWSYPLTKDAIAQMYADITGQEVVYEYADADANIDGRVDLTDFSILGRDWMINPVDFPSIQLSNTFTEITLPTGRKAVQLTSGSDYCYHLYYFIPSITRDGKYLIYHRRTNGDVQIYRLNLNTGESVKLTDGNATIGVNWWGTGAVSGVLDHRSTLNVATGKVVYFTGNDGRIVRMVDVETLEDELLFELPIGREASGQNCFTPDGKWFIYIDALRSNHYVGTKLMGYNFKTRELRQLLKVNLRYHHVEPYDNNNFLLSMSGHGVGLTDLTSGQYKLLRQGISGGIVHHIGTSRGMSYEVYNGGTNIGGLYNPFTDQKFEFPLPYEIYNRLPDDWYVHLAADMEGRLWFWESGTNHMIFIEQASPTVITQDLTGEWPMYGGGTGQHNHFHPILTPDRQWLLFIGGDATSQTNHLFLLDVSDLPDTAGIPDVGLDDGGHFPIYSSGDISSDGRVDIDDLIKLAEDWLSSESTVSGI